MEWILKQPIVSIYSKQQINKWDQQYLGSIFTKMYFDNITRFYLILLG